MLSILHWYSSGYVDKRRPCAEFTRCMYWYIGVLSGEECLHRSLAPVEAPLVPLVVPFEPLVPLLPFVPFVPFIVS
jgi:hypothetical protein